MLSRGRKHPGALPAYPRQLPPAGWSALLHPSPTHKKTSHETLSSTSVPHPACTHLHPPTHTHSLLFSPRNEHTHTHTALAIYEFCPAHPGVSPQHSLCPRFQAFLRTAPYHTTDPIFAAPFLSLPAPHLALFWHTPLHLHCIPFRPLPLRIRACPVSTMYCTPHTRTLVSTCIHLTDTSHH